MNETVNNGVRKKINNIEKIFFDGYWIKYYQSPKDNLSYKRDLIQSLTRRLFNHMEHGINIPGRFVDRVRDAYEAETDPRKKRVKGAMLAGALFNRGADIFDQLVEMEAGGGKIRQGNDLLHTCGKCLQEALKYGELVRHRNGDEGIDELWGEPFKALIMSIDDFYQSRYIKIALTMKNIDQVAGYMIDNLNADSRYNGIEPLIRSYAEKARCKCETLRTDDDIFEVWTDFVVAGEWVMAYEPKPETPDSEQSMAAEMERRHLLRQGVKLIEDITRARTVMKGSSKKFRALCERFYKITLRDL